MKTVPVSIKHFLVTIIGVEIEKRYLLEINLVDHQKVHVNYPIMDPVTCNMTQGFVQQVYN